MIFKAVKNIVGCLLGPLIVISSATWASRGSSIPSLGLGGRHDVVWNLLLGSGEDFHQAWGDLEISLRTEKWSGTTQVSNTSCPT